MNLSQLNRVLLQMLLLPVMALLFISGVLAWQILNAEQTVRGIQLSDSNIAAATLLGTYIVDEESGVRGYQNTSNEIFLQPFESASSPVQATAAQLRAGLAQDGGDVTLLDNFSRLHRYWVNEVAQPIINDVHAGRDTHDPGLNLHARATIENLRALIDQIVEAERDRRLHEIQRWQEQVHHTLEILVGSSVAVGLMIGVFSRGNLGQVTDAFSTQLAALRRNAHAVQASELRLRAVITSLVDGVIVVGMDGQIELLNQAAAELTGWPGEFAVHRPLSEVLRVVDDATHEPLESPVSVIQRAHGAVCLPTQHILIRRDGSELRIEDSAAPIRNAQGELAGVVLIVRDITEQIRTQKALVSSEKLATAGRLAAAIAHEIHNPLDSVINLIYLLNHDPAPEERQMFLQMAQSELNRVSQVSRAILGMYREASSPIAADIRELLESSLLLVSRRYIQANVELDVHIEDGELTVNGYPAELRQIFLNLLTNAVDASARGTRVRVQANAVENGGHERRDSGVLVHIEDEGAGIPEPTLSRLFQPFMTTKGEQGTGLGLWLSKGLVDKHNGLIHVESSTDPEHHGTTFSIFLPRTGLPAPAPATLTEHPQLA